MLKLNFVGRAARLVAVAGVLGGVMGGAHSALAQDNEQVEGFWVNGDANAVVEIAPCGTSSKRLCGTLVWQADGTAKDLAVGAELLKGFRPVADHWEKGKVTDVATGRTLDGKLHPQEDGSLKISQCRGGLCTYSNWQRPSRDMAALQSFFEKTGR
ncbi:MAG: DUF2147 domain-containing protein [Alphaproteobacteria bacterium]|nr:MAG: DUF2147 domain-containing protein [Alphaproteobacteria bacterium]